MYTSILDWIRWFTVHAKIIQKYPGGTTPTNLLCLYIYLVYLQCKCLSCHSVYLWMCLSDRLSVSLPVCQHAAHQKSVKSFNQKPLSAPLINDKGTLTGGCLCLLIWTCCHWVYCKVEKSRYKTKHTHTHTHTHISVSCGRWASSGSASFITFTHLRERQGKREGERQRERNE